MDIKAIIFDKDGTIADFGVTFNRATKLILDEICNGDPELMERSAQALHYDLSSNIIGKQSVIIAGTGIDIAEALSTVFPIEDIEDFGTVLDEMYGEICLNINAVDQMEALDIDHLFEHIFGADSGYGAKPGSGMIDAFVERLGLRPEHVLMVGDSIHDMEAGRAAGVNTCAVETGPATREELLHHADMVLSSITELPNALNAK